MARKKIEQVIGSWDEADRLLREMAACQGRVDGANAVVNDTVRKLTEELQQATAADAERSKMIRLALEQFCETHRDELDGKSKSLAAGVIGFRLTPPALKCARGVTWDDLVNTLIRMKRDALLIFTAPKPDKEAIKKLADEDPKLFAKLPVEIVQKDEFFAEPLAIEAVHADKAVAS